MFKNKLTKIIGLITLITIVILTTEYMGANENNEEEQVRFDLYMEELAISELQSSPVDATFTVGDLEKLGLEDLLYEIDDASAKGFMKQIDSAKKVLKDLKGFNYKGLTKEQKLTYDIVKFQNELIVEGEDFLYNTNGLQPMSGIQLEVPLAFMQVELESEGEVDAYLERLKKVPTLFQQVIEIEKEKAARNLMMPEYLYDDTLEQIDKITNTPEEYMLYLSFCERLDSLNLDASNKEEYKQKCLEIITNVIFPAYENLEKEIKEIKKLSTVEAGISEWDNGEDYYEYLIKTKTSYDMDVDQLREWAEDELSKGQQAVLTVAMERPELFETEDLYGLFPAIESKDEIYNIVNQIQEDLFLDYNVEIAKEHVIPDYLEDYLPAGFYFPISIDKEDYGNMYLSQDTYNNPGLDGFQLYLHENIPGHHMYFSVLYDKDIPMIRKIYDWLPYEEGWATYMQDLIYEYSGLDEDTEEFFKGNSQFANAYYILLDIGVHIDGWSREEAINRMTALGIPEEDVVESIDRIITNPGEIIHYMYGGYKMQGYLSKCKDELGEKFNIKDFHDLILENGGVPFVLMDKVVNEYIKENK